MSRSSKKRNISQTSESLDEKNDEPITNLVVTATRALATIQDMQTDRAYYVGLVAQKMRKYSEREQIQIEERVNDLFYETEVENCPTE
ncbi:hypothetical protein QYM36_019176 [Artemia franciscana]|uniref:Uncharacterized protein n=1 Tax=Artemia franciscana TaxID=6661 RepID=A0AA88KTZ9_ARTSF|nr:hypothetical protein QYM36_019176 [Artemia franciscana]